MKVVYTQGYLISKQDEQEDYIYFIFKGKCRLLVTTSSLPNPSIFQGKNRKQLVIGTLKRGDSFGETSALNDLPNPFTVECMTKEVHVYKILRGHLIQYFGGELGDPVL
jgi:CRP-like cAMP-binding protein